MSILPNLETLSPSRESVSPAAQLDGMVTLRISGGRPLRMQAELLTKCSSWSAGAPTWHEVTLYRRVSGDYAVGLKTCCADGENDLFHACVFPELEQALDWLQSFDPTLGLSIDFDASDRRLSTTDLALRAAALRLRADRVGVHYRAMIGDLLYRFHPESFELSARNSKPHTPNADIADTALAEISIGPGMLMRLRQLGLQTTADLARADAGQLRSALGDISRLVDVETWINTARQTATAKTDATDHFALGA